MATTHDGFVRVIGAFKLVKAALLICIGLAGLLAVPHDVVAFVQHAIRWLGLSPGRENVHQALGKLSVLDHATAQKIGAASLVYATLFLIEGVGLLRGRRWAEWMTVGVTASFVPMEIYELTVHFSVGKVVTLALNLAILIYLVHRRLAERRRFTARLGRAVGVA